MAIGTFTRFCWRCKQNKVALGGRVQPRIKMWLCKGCTEGKSMEFNNGNPPSVGWWPTKMKAALYYGTYRWWDGKRWSWAAFAHESAAKAAHWAEKKEARQLEVEWANRPKDWPERSKT